MILYSAALPDIRMAFEISDSRSADLFLVAGFGGGLGIAAGAIITPGVKNCFDMRKSTIVRDGRCLSRWSCCYRFQQMSEGQHVVLLLLGLVVCTSASLVQWIVPLQHRLWSVALCVVFLLSWSQSVCSAATSLMTSSWGGMSAGALACVQSGYNLGALVTPFVVRRLLNFHNFFLLLAVGAAFIFMIVLGNWCPLPDTKEPQRSSLQRLSAGDDTQLIRMSDRFETGLGVSLADSAELCHRSDSSGSGVSEITTILLEPTSTDGSIATTPLLNNFSSCLHDMHPQRVLTDCSEAAVVANSDGGLGSSIKQMAQSGTFWFFFVAMFIYVGTESCLMSWMDREMQELNRVAYSDLIVSLFWSGTFLGRLVFSFVNIRFEWGRSEASRTVLLCLALAATTVLASLLIVFLDTDAAFPLIASVGLTCAPCFPLLLIWGSQVIGATAHGCASSQQGASLPVSGMLLAAAAGSGTLVEIQGLAWTRIGIRYTMLLSPLCAAACLVAVLLFRARRMRPASCQSIES